MPQYENGTYWYSGSVTLGIWAKKAGAWVKVTQVTAFVNATYQQGGVQTIYFDETFSVDLGPGVQAFGVTIDGNDGTSAALSDFVSAAWSATASSNERSATPSGQQSTIIVIPQ